MNPSFALDHGELANCPESAELAAKLSASGRIDSTESFNSYCRQACWLWTEELGSQGKTTAHFDELLERIERHEENTISTPWGGVVITLHEHPRVEKYLVVRRGGYLALEKHAEKDEHLEVREGAGLILFRQTADQPLKVQALTPGAKFHFEPGQEHCIVGTENLLVFERSIDPKGMDQDLIFIYEPVA